MALITLVVPCFNEERRLNASAFLRFSHPEHRVKFLFVDDGSTDGTRRAVERMAASDSTRVALLSLPHNSGKAEAVRHGLRHALDEGPQYVGFWDADLATPLSELPRFIALLDERRELLMVMGSRVMLLGRHIERHAYRHYVGRIFATCASTALKLAVYDTQCGAKLFRVSNALRRALGEPFLTRWLVDIEIIARFLSDPEVLDIQGAIYELPLREWSDIEGSKVTPVDFVRAMLDLVAIRRKYGLGKVRRKPRLRREETPAKT
jgi:dolichyl-phosphate beta-glucosyltransferase